MTQAQLTLNDIIQMTIRDGGTWALSHVQRLLKLMEQIGADLPHDSEALTLATYLHDWGAFPCYALKDMEHAERSRQVAETEILPYMELSPEKKAVILEAIGLHDYRDQRPTIANEALLLREADMLEFLGMIGMARDFARGPRDIEACYKRILSRRDDIQGRFSLPCSKQIAQVRLDRMAQGLDWLKEETFGIF